MSRQWLDHHEVWFAGAQAAFGRIRKKDCDEEILQDAQSALEELERVRDVIEYEVERLQAFVHELEKQLST